jgi:site-specific DNA recombinase
MSVLNPHINERTKRCAIYTRKSTSIGLDAEVSSLQSQREVCQAYIKCQAHRNWVELPAVYDDGGYSGGTLERPALQRMVADIEAGRIDVIVIYKIDRLSRSLTDFVRLMDLLDKYDASFVSVTQTFDTSDSMGRLVLNILLIFAQFERELMSDRVRDKKAAMRRQGLFTGGTPPIGYIRSRRGKLIVDPEWGKIVQEIFRRFPEVSANQLANDLRARGITTRRYRCKNGNVHGGQRLYSSNIVTILKNPIYAGNFVHRGEWMKAAVQPLVTRDEWDLAQNVLCTRFPQIRDPIRSFLLGILHDEHGRRMKVLARGPGRSKTYRYYRSESAGWSRGTIHRKILVEADRVEQLAVSAIKGLFVDRVKLKEAVLSLGLYSDETARLLKKGQLAARRISLMNNVQLREAFLALVPRAEVSKSGLRLLVSCHELSQFLAWDGQGIFKKSVLKPGHGADRFRLVYAPAFLICGHHFFGLPINPCPDATSSPDPHLVRLLEEASEWRQFMLANRTKSIDQLAKEKRVGPTFFARMLRINYLAPDIQTAIFDGTQPASLTPRVILYGAMPLDWEQQRQLMGF